MHYLFYLIIFLFIILGIIFGIYLNTLLNLKLQKVKGELEDRENLPLYIQEVYLSYEKRFSEQAFVFPIVSSLILYLLMSRKKDVLWFFTMHLRNPSPPFPHQIILNRTILVISSLLLTLRMGINSSCRNYFTEYFCYCSLPRVDMSE